jgi:ribosome-binding factor A
MTRRTERIQELIREELSDLLMREMRDPRLEGLISITRVEVSPDLVNARVFVSVMSETADPDDAIKALTAASGFLHRGLRQRIRELRRMPFLTFRLDQSISEGAAVLAHIDEALREDAAHGQQ